MQEQDGFSFHQDAVRVYAGDAAIANVHKRGVQMARVRYGPSHPNPGYRDWRAGQGVAHCVWVASEQGGQAEHISRGGLDALLDCTLEPGSSIGWHVHEETEEFYYLLDGELTVQTEDELGRTHTDVAVTGDSVRVGPGGSHAALAGASGARFVCVLLKAGPR
jgi:quercetin dioxygenase-like cupin family protein